MLVRSSSLVEKACLGRSTVNQKGRNGKKARKNGGYSERSNSPKAPNTDDKEESDDIKK